ncbi:MAG: TIGR02253 family HAD-type hydrolase [archaeon]|jgi:putative hydrolase of the HAD superfamily|nr:haloacid dehalogenase [Euryarchaeota archaeon]MDP6704233.1 TIGR02253 family HAD-type hydrolase [archaeon]|tara:strand:+ start:4397 stop:5047 length:651 start_codon:yes stop_codon:yes gene_type:complete
MKCIFFDLDGTLVDTRKLVEMSRRKSVSAMMKAGLPGTEEKIYESLLKIVEKTGSNYDRHFNELLKEHQVQMAGKIIAAGVISYHESKQNNITPFDGIPEMLDELKKKYTLCVLTNGKLVKQWEKIIRLKIEKYFEFVFVSEEVGKRKPDPAIFLYALKNTGFKAEECIMVGDRDTDLLPAKELGMATISVGDIEGADFSVTNPKDILDRVKQIES